MCQTCGIKFVFVTIPMLFAVRNPPVRGRADTSDVVYRYHQYAQHAYGDDDHAHIQHQVPEGLALDRIPPLENPGDGEGDEGQDTGKDGQERGMTIGSRILSQTETTTSNWNGWMM